MTKEFFVMLTCQNGGIAPMMDGDDLATFDTEFDAVVAAEGSVLGSAFGYEVFQNGGGVACK